MANKLTAEQIGDLLDALIDTPYWYSKTNADYEPLGAIETWGYIACVALQKLTDALDSTNRAPRTNGSSIEIRDAVREQTDVLEEIIQEVD